MNPVSRIDRPRARRRLRLAIAALVLGLLPFLYYVAAGWSFRLPWELPDQAPIVPVLTGDIRYHEKFRSEILGNERMLVVYLPPGYEGVAGRRYPVLYMHDGQTLFDASAAGAEWQADETAQRLIEAGRIPPIIIVGIYSTLRRSSEFAPWSGQGAGRGQLYARFVVEEVIPYINQTYRTQPGREHTAIGGSSLGGLISLYIATTYPDKFSMAAVLSPAALVWKGRRPVEVLTADRAVLKRLRLWLDMGTAEWDDDVAQQKLLVETRRLAQICNETGLTPGRDFVYTEVEGGTHQEGEWAERLEEVLLFFFGEEGRRFSPG